MIADSGEGKKELLFSGGAGALSYEMGYTQSLLEIVGIEKLKEYHIGGVSCGAACGIALYTSLYLSSDYDMRYWYKNHARKFYEPENKKYYGLFTNGGLIYRISEEVWDMGQKLGVPSPNKNFHIMTAGIKGFGLEKVIIDEFDDAKDYAKGMLASCFLPGITQLGLYVNYKGRKMLDGGLTREIPSKFEKSKKIIISVLPSKEPFIKCLPENTTSLEIYEPYNLSFPIDYWIWKESWGDDMFLKGYLAGMHHKDEIVKAFELDTKEETTN